MDFDAWLAVRVCTSSREMGGEAKAEEAEAGVGWGSVCTYTYEQYCE